MPKVAYKIGANAMLSFYLWLASLVVIMGKITCFIIEGGIDNVATEIILAVVALVICLAQFGVGHWLGRKYGDTVAGAQALGQKNTLSAKAISQTECSSVREPVHPPPYRHTCDQANVPHQIGQDI